jgi:hypothetical protein
MNKTTQYAAGVQAVVNKARIHNSEIGYYEMHILNADFKFAVKLSNGRLVMSVEIAQDMELGPQYVSEERIKAVATTFQKRN